jgi:hypothetical protein
VSLEILLLPAGMAAVAAIRQARDSSLCEGCKATNIAGKSILLSALARLGAVITAETEDRVEGKLAGNNFVFQKMGDAFLGKTLSESEMTTEELLSKVQEEAGFVFQEMTVQKVREQANALGLTLVTEAQQNGEIRMVFETVGR